VNLESGKAPAIVVADADLDLAAKAIRQAGILNTGQVCNSPERVYFDRRVSEQFVERLAAEMKATRYGDPSGDQPIDIGPIINNAGVDKIRGLVESATARGAQTATGGKVADLGAGKPLRAYRAGELPAGHGRDPEGCLRPGPAGGHVQRPGRGDRLRNDTVYERLVAATGSAVVIDGGLLGLEAAYGLLAAGAGSTRPCSTWRLG
jgi:hypothetical protein